MWREKREEIQRFTSSLQPQNNTAAMNIRPPTLLTTMNWPTLATYLQMIAVRSEISVPNGSFMTAFAADAHMISIIPKRSCNYHTSHTPNQLLRLSMDRGEAAPSNTLRINENKPSHAFQLSINGYRISQNLPL